MENNLPAIACFSCGGLFPEMEGPVHRYMDSSPGCWAAFGEVLAREYSDFRYGSVHRLTVDAYAVQHPGQPSPQTIQSVAVHLGSLYLVLEKELSSDYAARVMDRLTDIKASFHWLEPPAGLGALTVADVLPAKDGPGHVALVRRWAASAWAAWGAHHRQVKEWVEAL